MNERTIFLQALEKASEAERSAYLAEACGQDVALQSAGSANAQDILLEGRAGAYTMSVFRIADGSTCYSVPFVLTAGETTRHRIPPQMLATSPENQGFTPIFNGKDLTGWRAVGGKPGAWKVENGVLRGSGDAGYLVSDKIYDDFHLKAEVRISPRHGWGMDFRTDRAGRGCAADFTYDGPTRDVLKQIRMQVRFASNGVPGAVFVGNYLPDKWYPIDVIARGDGVNIELAGGALGGGKLTLSPGPIILRLAKPDAVLEFRKIEMKELPSTKAAAKEPTDLDRLQGVWKSIEVGPNYLEVTFDGDHLTLTRTTKSNPPSDRRPKPEVEGLVQLDTTAQPRRIVVLDPSTEKRRLLGIYRLEGDTLSLCFRTDPPDGAYPGQFATNPAAGAELRGLRRARRHGILEARWVFEAAEYQGKPVDADEAKDMFPSEMVITGEQYGLVWSGKRHEGKLSLDSTKRPAEIDFSGSVFDVLKPRKAIYELDGDRLKLCLPFVGPNADPPRPTSFVTDPQSKNAVLIYRRAGASAPSEPPKTAPPGGDLKK
jgi:uncharacterized protein (TIGR03067 family)